MGHIIKKRSEFTDERSNFLVRRHPAEWEPQRATWLAWPHNKREWGNKLSDIKKFYVILIGTILDFQDVKLIVPNEKTYFEVKGLFKKKKYKCHIIIIPNNDVWIRDYGPFFLKGQENNSQKPKAKSCKLIVDFQFNAWGEKFPPFHLDSQVPKNIALYLGEKCESYPFILEGGAIDFNGDGIAITTKECLLNKNRNPRLNKNKLEYFLKSVFNLKEIIWLEKGLKGDHTDGHVDNVARFIGKNKILINRGLKTKEEILKWAEKHNKKFEIIEVPLPQVKVSSEHYLPASYLNFIFVNKGLLVPTFNLETDEEVLDIFQKVFPKRKVMGINCTTLVQEGGALHCITKQEPLL